MCTVQIAVISGLCVKVSICEYGNNHGCTWDREPPWTGRADRVPTVPGPGRLMWPGCLFRRVCHKGQGQGDACCWLSQHLLVSTKKRRNMQLLKGKVLYKLG